MHPRNRHRGRYDFARLTAASPGLGAFAVASPAGGLTVDFTDPAAVRALNRALLRHHYGIEGWELPEGYLCPPIPGRADYVHHLADLLSGARGPAVRVLDIGTGASCIYPILGHAEYGWSFVGSEIDPGALASARRILGANPALGRAVELRRAPATGALLRGVVGAAERFDATICNPPFHASAADARAGSRRKWANLGKGKSTGRNFGGHAPELWCPGGEAAFVGRLIQESVEQAERVRWFTTLVSKAENLPAIRSALARAGARETRILEMAQGQKRSRAVAWTFRGAGGTN